MNGTGATTHASRGEQCQASAMTPPCHEATPVSSRGLAGHPVPAVPAATGSPRPPPVRGSGRGALLRVSPRRLCVLFPQAEPPPDLPRSSLHPAHPLWGAHALPGSQPGFLAPVAFDPAAPPRSWAPAALAAAPGPLTAGWSTLLPSKLSFLKARLSPSAPVPCSLLHSAWRSHPRGIDKDSVWGQLHAQELEENKTRET